MPDEAWRYCVCSGIDGAGITGIITADVDAVGTVATARKIAATLGQGYEGDVLVLIGPHNITLYRLERGGLIPSTRLRWG